MSDFVIGCFTYWALTFVPVVFIIECVKVNLPSRTWRDLILITFVLTHPITWLIGSYIVCGDVLDNKLPWVK